MRLSSAIWLPLLVAACSHDHTPCTPEGDDIALKTLGAACCSGLSWINNTRRDSSGMCAWISPPDVQICARCGDHICTKGENDCNCPQDCSPGGATAADANVSAPCTPDGEEIALRTIGAACCSGQPWINNVQRDDGGTCSWISPPDVQICARCGDHVCSKGENGCNCAQDCSPDAMAP
jgi:hypothetical protein